MALDMKRFAAKIDEELALVEKELGTIARRNPSNKEDWEATAPEEQDPDPNVTADKFEELADNAGVLEELEVRYRELIAAKKRVADGTYGTCEAGGEPIEEERLEANPAARTCLKHTPHTKR